jgi:signal-transduction protein with cAMP-binding, CBS, and nucleotidyltransferase domain
MIAVEPLEMTGPWLVLSTAMVNQLSGVNYFPIKPSAVAPASNRLCVRYSRRMTIDKVSALRRTALFGSLNESELSVVAERAVEHKLGRGEILFLAGDPPRGLYVIVEGAVRAYRVGPDGREQVIHVERAGATVGEVPFFDEGSYPSTVAGEEQSILLFIARAEVFKLLTDHPAIAIAALKVLASRLRNCASLVETLSLHF